MSPHDPVDRDAATALVAPAARRFVAALRTLEDDDDLEHLVAVGTDDTRWRSTGVNRAQIGADGARHFWAAYRRAYATISSEFTSVTETPVRAVLEWTSTGRHHDGRPVRYSGVTVLELGEPTDDQTVRSVQLYFDTMAAQSIAPEHNAQDDTDTGLGARSMLDAETSASGRNSGLAPQDEDVST